MQLMVRLLTGATIMVEAEASDTIAELKQIIRRREAAITRGVLALPPGEGPRCRRRGTRRASHVARKRCRLDHCGGGGLAASRR